MVSKIDALNTVNRISENYRGSVLTNWGSGGFTEAAAGSGVVSTYSPPSGKRARITGILAVTAMGGNTQLKARVFDQTLGRNTEVAILTAVGKQEFTALLRSTDNMSFSGDSGLNNGAGTCFVTIEELPV